MDEIGIDEGRENAPPPSDETAIQAGDAIKGEQIKMLPECSMVFARIDGKIYFVSSGKESSNIYDFLCDDLRVVAYARDTESNNWGRLLRFRDLDGVEKDYFLSAQNIGRDGERVISELRKMGLHMTMKRDLLQLISVYAYMALPENDGRVRCSDRIGWHADGAIFLRPDSKIIGTSDESYAVTHNGVPHNWKSQGTLEEWQQHVSRLCIGNSRMILTVCAGFASPLLTLLNAEGGGFNLVGNSSEGKTTALYPAASLLGLPKRYIQRWRATDNGIEGVAKLHNDSLLILDELGELDSTKAGQCAYMLANGGGKIRANTRGDARHKAEWTLIFLSSAEITLEEHMSETGRMVRAGQQARFADIPSDAGAGFGAFEELHDIADPALFSDTVKKNASMYYGTAFQAFVEELIKNRDQLANWVRHEREMFEEGYFPKGVSGQITRVASRFALVAAAGEIATSLGITGWEEGEASRGVGKCLNDWLNGREHTGRQEERQILAAFRGYLQQYGESRFVAARYNSDGKLIPVDSQRQPNRLDGYKILKANDEVEFYIFSESFNEICSGFNRSTTNKFLAENGYILKASDGRYQPQKRLPSIKQTRVYHFTSKILTD